MPAVIVWFRHDLRLEDHPALAAALHHGGPVVPVYIWAPEEEGDWAPGAASRYWLHQSLQSLMHSLAHAGSPLILRRGESLKVLRDLIGETGADTVLWSRRYEPAIVRRDKRIKEALVKSGIRVQSFNASLLHEPWTIQTRAGGPYQVFTPFSRAVLATPPPSAPLPAPRSLPAPGRRPGTLGLDELELEPRIDWAAGIRRHWQPGVAGAQTQLARFLKSALRDYASDRNRPDRPGTSRLSPHLHFGELSPRQVWAALQRHATTGDLKDWPRNPFVLELLWREFAHHLLHHFPQTPRQPLRPEFRAFPWQRDRQRLRRWQQGRTGYPIVDAGMRELWATGWMHNRVRMIAASFLVKDLLISWEQGARWFWETLVDADLANNTLGWQWTAGCGADAAPFFRIFNPVTQGETFDPQGTYVRRWVPELAGLPAALVHKPWKADPDLLRKTGYPEPIVNHAIARNVALEAFQNLKGRQASARGETGPAPGPGSTPDTPPPAGTPTPSRG